MYGAESVDPNAMLSWTPGVSAVAHDVYLGTSLLDVNSATDPNVLPGRGRQDSNSYAPAGFLEFGTTYYWRIDEVNNLDSNSPWNGSVWKFTVDDGKAKNPSPADGIENVNPDANLTWTLGALATSRDVYFGTNFNDVASANDSWPVGISVYKGRQGANNYDPCDLELDTNYYWRN